MAVAIRLTRVGATKRPAYRVIAIDKRRSRDGRALEILGYYDPLTEPATVQLETAKIQAWIGKGAQPSDTVVKLMRQSEQAAAQASAAAAALACAFFDGFGLAARVARFGFSTSAPAVAMRSDWRRSFTTVSEG